MEVGFIPPPKECIWTLTFGVIKFQSTTWIYVHVGIIFIFFKILGVTLLVLIALGLSSSSPPLEPCPHLCHSHLFFLNILLTLSYWVRFWQIHEMLSFCQRFLFSEFCTTMTKHFGKFWSFYFKKLLKFWKILPNFWNHQKIKNPNFHVELS